jgi:hypothetical protein
MRTDYIVSVVCPVSGPVLGHAARNSPSYKEAVKLALSDLAFHEGNAVVSIWARQGRNMWPVRIYYPGTEHNLDGSPPSLPIIQDPTPVYTLSTHQPSGFPITLPSEQ